MKKKNSQLKLLQAPTRITNSHKLPTDFFMPHINPPRFSLDKLKQPISVNDDHNGLLFTFRRTASHQKFSAVSQLPQTINKIQIKTSHKKQKISLPKVVHPFSQHSQKQNIKLSKKVLRISARTSKPYLLPQKQVGVR